MERFTETDCSKCGVPVNVDLDPQGDLVRYDDAQRALDAEREKVADLEYEMHRKWESDTFCDEKAGGQLAHKPYVPLAKRLEDQLSQFQTLVRALPVCIPTSLEIFDAPDGNGFDVYGAIIEPYSVGWIGTFLRRTEAGTYIAVLKARATMDATTPAPRQKQGHSCEIPGCGSCANPAGGDGE